MEAIGRVGRCFLYLFSRLLLMPEPIYTTTTTAIEVAEGLSKLRCSGELEKSLKESRWNIFCSCKLSNFY